MDVLLKGRSFCISPAAVTAMAVTAAGLMQNQQALWPQIQAAIEGPDQR